MVALPEDGGVANSVARRNGRELAVELLPSWPLGTLSELAIGLRLAFDNPLVVSKRTGISGFTPERISKVGHYRAPTRVASSAFRLPVIGELLVRCIPDLYEAVLMPSLRTRPRNKRPSESG